MNSFTLVPAPAPASRKLRLALGVLVIGAPVFFWLFTGNIWEDFFITYRCSTNLVEGHGLVFEAGRRVHAFTSPLGTLLPAGIAQLLGSVEPVPVLNGFRVLACVALGLAWLLAAPRRAGAWALALAAVFWGLDVKVAAFATNGMETALLILAVVAAWRTLLDRRPVLAGAALGMAMWTRPDGFVFVGALAISHWLLGGRAKWRWRDWLVMAATAAVLYTPWFAWAWAYYGSPVPNTVLAKGADARLGDTLRLLVTYPFRYGFTHCAAHDAFLPPYFFFGPWPAWLKWYGHAMAVGAAAVAVWPRCDRGARVAGAAFFLGGLYLSVTTRAPWYFPAWSVLAYLALAGGFVAAWSVLATIRGGRVALVAVAGALVAAQAWLFAAVSVQLRAQQELIEWGVRAPLGRTLRESAQSPGETVFLEPLGYIGYFSNLAMRDNPGLCAPEVITLRKSGLRSMGSLAEALQTDWVILRGSEYAGLTAAERSALERDYFLSGARDARPRVAAVGWLPGREFLEMDAYFTVWRRKGPPGPRSP